MMPPKGQSEKTVVPVSRDSSYSNPTRYLPARAALYRWALALIFDFVEAMNTVITYWARNTRYGVGGELWGGDAPK